MMMMIVCSGLGYIVGSYVAALFGQWQWSLRVSEYFLLFLSNGTVELQELET